MVGAALGGDSDGAQTCLGNDGTTYYVGSSSIYAAAKPDWPGMTNGHKLTIRQNSLRLGESGKCAEVTKWVGSRVYDWEIICGSRGNLAVDNVTRYSTAYCSGHDDYVIVRCRYVY